MDLIKKGIMMMTAGVLSLSGCATERQGAVCFTFDDYHGDNWLKADPLFKKYDAHATFFVGGAITPEKGAVMKQLQDAGHTVGLHTLHHKDALPFIHEQGEAKYIAEEIAPQLEACRKYGLNIRSFAYPNNRRDEASDRMLEPYFDHFRAGNGPARKPIFYPLKSLPEKCYLGGTGIGSYYNSDLETLKQLITHAAETDSLLVFFSHNIGPAAKIGRIDMPLEWLEELLAHARKHKVRIVGFDELNALKKSRSDAPAAASAAPLEEKQKKSDEMKIGWAKVDVTPSGPCMLAGQMYARLATSVLDPLSATVLALESGNEKVIMISLDSVGFRQPVLDAVRNKISKTTGVPPMNIIGFATHTHTAPHCGEVIPKEYWTSNPMLWGSFRGNIGIDIDEIRKKHPDFVDSRQYADFLMERLTRAAQEAWDNRAPGKIAYGQGSAAVGECRRLVMKGKGGVMYAQ